MVVRIMLMVPLYAVSSLISLFSLEAAFVIDAIRDIYEVSDFSSCSVLSSAGCESWHALVESIGPTVALLSSTVEQRTNCVMGLPTDYFFMIGVRNLLLF